VRRRSWRSGGVASNGARSSRQRRCGSGISRLYRPTVKKFMHCSDAISSSRFIAAPGLSKPSTATTLTRLPRSSKTRSGSRTMTWSTIAFRRPGRRTAACPHHRILAAKRGLLSSVTAILIPLPCAQSYAAALLRSDGSETSIPCYRRSKLRAGVRGAFSMVRS
jgi:hypothetical protein